MQTGWNETIKERKLAKEIGKEVGEALFGGRKWASLQDRLLETSWIELSRNIDSWEDLNYEEKEELYCEALDSALVYTRLTVLLEVLERRARLGQEENQILERKETAK
jgi:hypothetical protein